MNQSLCAAHLKVVCILIIILVDFLGEQRHWISDEQVGDMLRQQMINSWNKIYFNSML